MRSAGKLNVIPNLPEPLCFNDVEGRRRRGDFRYHILNQDDTIAAGQTGLRDEELNLGVG